MPTQGPEFLTKRLRPFAFLPAALTLGALIVRYGIGSLHWDEWGCEAPLLQAYLDGSLGAKAWLAQCNESRPVLPKFIWLVLTLVSGAADPRWEMFTGWFIVCLTAWNLHKLSTGSAGFLFVAAALLFSPIQQENWLWGAQMMLFLPAFFLTTWLRIAQAKHPHAIAWGSALAILATFSFANGFLLWPALFATLPYFDRSQRKRAVAWWAACFLVTLAAYFYSFVNVASSPSYSAILASPLTAVQYFLNFLGGPLAAGEMSRAWIVGLCLLLALAALLVKQRTAASLPWMILAGYALTSAALATVGRVALGPLQALDSRYGAFAVWLPIAVLGLTWQALQPRWRAAVAIAILVAHAPSFQHGVRNMHYRTLSARFQRACLTFLNTVEGNTCAGHYPVWSPDFLRQAAAPLDQAGWIAPPLFRPNEAIPTPEATGEGNLEAIAGPEGWIFQGGVGGDPDAVVVALERDHKYIPIELAEPGRTVPMAVSPSAWRAEVHRSAIPAGSRVAAFAYRATEPRWLRIGGPWIAP